MTCKSTRVFHDYDDNRKNNNPLGRKTCSGFKKINLFYLILPVNNLPLGEFWIL